MKDSATGCWDRGELRRCVLAGGATEEFFSREFEALVAKFATEQQAIATGIFHSAGGNLCYLVSGRKSQAARPSTD